MALSAPRVMALSAPADNGNRGLRGDGQPGGRRQTQAARLHQPKRLQDSVSRLRGLHRSAITACRRRRIRRPHPGLQGGGHRALHRRSLDLEAERVAQQQGHAEDGAQGLAMPLPAMSGAVPWMGSYRPRVPSPSEAEGSRPIDPASIDASSVKMSPNMFSVTITSKSAGRRMRYIAQASTRMCSSSRWGNCRAPLRGDPPPQPRRLEHVGLVHRGQLAPPPLGEAGRPAHHPPTSSAVSTHSRWPSASWSSRRSRCRRSARARPAGRPRSAGLSGGPNRRGGWSPGAGWRTGPAPCECPASPARAAPWRRGHPTWGRPPRPAAPRRPPGRPAPSRRAAPCRCVDRAAAQQRLAQLERVAEPLADRLQHLHRFGDHFGPDAIAGQNCNLRFHLSVYPIHLV